MALKGLPHRVVSSLLDSSANWEWLLNATGQQVEYGTPVGDTDPADKKYVDDAVAGVPATTYHYVCLRDEKAANTAGGGFTSGSWVKRTLNTEQADTGGHASLSSSVITLSAGTYRVRIRVPGFVCATHRARLRRTNNTASTLLVGGTAVSETSSGVGTQTDSIIVGRITVAATDTLEIQHNCTVTRATDGLGRAINDGEVEVYTVAEFWKEP